MPAHSQKTSVGTLLEGRRGSIAALAVTSLAGGVAEALFLVVITRAAFAITGGKEQVGILAGRYLSIGGMIALAFGLVVLRVVFALISTWQSSRISNRVMADIRRELAHAFLRSSWSVQQDQRAGRLQELLTTFAGAGATLVGNVTAVITSGFNLVALIGLAIAVDPAGSVVVVLAVAILGSVLRPVRTMVRRQSGLTANAEWISSTSSRARFPNSGMEVLMLNLQFLTEAMATKMIDGKNDPMNERLGLLRFGGTHAVHRSRPTWRWWEPSAWWPRPTRRASPAWAR